MSSTSAILTTSHVVDPWTQRPIVGKFRIVSGVHSEGAVPGTYRVDPTGTPMSQPRVYNTGDVVASRSDLEKHNPVEGDPKFLRVDDSLPDKYDAQERELAAGIPPTTPIKESQVEVDEELEPMTVRELQQLAKEEEIELGDITRKQEIINWIKGSREAKRRE